jgi:aerobic-type carbon monoxide dehydrogenase small subunit (CoxS/CutS family)
MQASALLARNPKPTREQIQRGIEGNLCRCTGYVKIVEAIEAAAEASSAEAS